MQLFEISRDVEAASFDTLEFAKRRREADFTEKQAETLAFAGGDVVESRLATKEDLARRQHDLEEKIALTELRLKPDLTLRLGGMLAAAVAIGPAPW